MLGYSNNQQQNIQDRTNYSNSQQQNIQDRTNYSNSQQQNIQDRTNYSNSQQQNIQDRTNYSNTQQQNIQDRINVQPISMHPMNQPMQRNNIQRLTSTMNPSNNNNNNNNNTIEMNSMNSNAPSATINPQNPTMGNDGMYGMYPYSVSMVSNNANNYYQYNAMGGNYSIYQQPQQQPQPQPQSQPTQPPQPPQPQNQPYFMPQISQPNPAPSQSQTPSQSTTQPTHPTSLNQPPGMMHAMPQPPAQSNLPQPPSQQPFYTNPSSSYLMDMSNNHSNGQGLTHQNSLMGNTNAGNFNPGANNGMNTFNANLSSMNYNSNNSYSPFNTNLYTNLNSGYNTTSSSNFNTNANPSLNNSNNSSVVSTPNPYNTNYMAGNTMMGNNATAMSMSHLNSNSSNTNGNNNGASVPVSSTQDSSNVFNGFHSNTTNTNVGFHANASSTTNTNVGFHANANNTTNTNVGFHANASSTTNSNVGFHANASSTTNSNVGFHANASSTTNSNVGFHANANNTSNTNVNTNSSSSAMTPFVNSINSQLNPNAAVFTLSTPSSNDHSGVGSQKESLLHKKASTSFNSPALGLTQESDAKSRKDASGSSIDTTKENESKGTSLAGEGKDSKDKNVPTEGNDINSRKNQEEASIDSGNKSFTPSGAFMGNSSYGGLTTSNIIGNTNSVMNTPSAMNTNSSFSNFSMGGMNGGNTNANRNSLTNSLMGMNSSLVGGNGNTNLNGFNGGGMMMSVMPPNGGNGMMGGSHLMGGSSVFSTNSNWSTGFDGPNRMNLPMNSNGNGNALSSNLGGNSMKGLGGNMNAFSMSNGPNSNWEWNSNFPYTGSFYDNNKFNSGSNGSSNDFYHSSGDGGRASIKGSGPSNNLNLISNLTNNMNNMSLSSGPGGFGVLNNTNGLLSNTANGGSKGRMNNGLGITGTSMSINTNTPNLHPAPPSAQNQDLGSGHPMESLLNNQKSEGEGVEEGHELKESSSGLLSNTSLHTTPNAFANVSSTATGSSLLAGKVSKEELILNSKEFVPSLKHELMLSKEMSTLKMSRDKLFNGSNASSLKPSPNLVGISGNERRLSYGSGTFNPSNSTSSINTLVNYNMNNSANSSISNLSSSTDLVLKKKKSSVIPFTTRPGFGQAGRKIKLKANFYAIQNLPIENVHQYEFVIVQKSPRKDTNISPELLRLLYQRWWEIFKKENHKPLYPAFDGRHYIFSATPLPFPNDKAVYTINLVRDGNVSSERVFEITLRKVQEISMAGLHQFLEGKNLEVPTEALSVIDTIFRHFPSFLDNQFSIVGRSFFTNDDIEEISNGVQLWRGHHQSLKASRDRLLINIDISATAFYKPGSLKDVIQNFFGKDDLKILLNDTERQHIESFLKGIKIKINYRDNSRRTYKILRFSNLPANQQMITNIQTKNEQSVTDYFKETYGITLKYPHIPCIDVGKVSQPIYIPIELCEVPDGQKYLKKLNEKQTTEMIKFTCQLPNLREGKINSGRKRLQPDNNEYFNSLNLHISNQMEIVDARILPAPTIVFNKESQEPKIRPNGGIWSLKNKKLALGSTLSSWSILAFGKETDYPRETINNFLVELVKTLKENGVNVRNPNPPICYGNKNEIEESLYKAYHEACNSDVDIIGEEDEDHLTSIRPGINRKLILCILPSRVNNTTPYYAEIKRIADTVIGVVTQCIQGRHITSPIKSYCGNLSLKINVKLGGYNNFILPEQIRFIMEEPTIVFGGNVTNPGPGDRIHPSIVALVGSMDCQCSHYIATTRIQERKKECIIKLSEMIVILFEKFYKINELMPKRILFYRDSISESQYQSVMQYELNEIREACKMMEPGYRPTITYIVVQKRHHARFFPIRKEESDNKGNILAGTVIESLITHPSQFDFYLCSHPGLQGTSRPTHYHVLYDEHNFTADELEELTYHMCFLYSRSTRAVSIVPPAYYAHLAAARVKYHAHEAWNEQEQQQQQPQQSQSTSSNTTVVTTTGTENSPNLVSESLEGSNSGSNSTLASSTSSPTLEKSNTITNGNSILTSSPSTSSLKANQPIRRVLYEQVKEELQEIMYFM